MYLQFHLFVITLSLWQWHVHVHRKKCGEWSLEFSIDLFSGITHEINDFTVKSIKNQLNNLAEIMQNIYQLIFLWIDWKMHCKIVQRSLSDFVPDLLYRKYGVESNAWFKCMIIINMITRLNIHNETKRDRERTKKRQSVSVTSGECCAIPLVPPTPRPWDTCFFYAEQTFRSCCSCS